MTELMRERVLLFYSTLLFSSLLFSSLLFSSLLHLPLILNIQWYDKENTKKKHKNAYYLINIPVHNEDHMVLTSGEKWRREMDRETRVG